MHIIEKRHALKILTDHLLNESMNGFFQANVKPDNVAQMHKRIAATLEENELNLDTPDDAATLGVEQERINIAANLKSYTQYLVAVSFQKEPVMQERIEKIQLGSAFQLADNDKKTYLVLPEGIKVKTVTRSSKGSIFFLPINNPFTQAVLKKGQGDSFSFNNKNYAIAQVV